MLADMVNQQGNVEEIKRYNITNVSLTMTEAQKNDTTKQYSLKDIFDAFSKTSVAVNTTTASTTTASTATTVVRG